MDKEIIEFNREELEDIAEEARKIGNHPVYLLHLDSILKALIVKGYKIYPGLDTRTICDCGHQLKDHKDTGWKTQCSEGKCNCDYFSEKL